MATIRRAMTGVSGLTLQTGLALGLAGAMFVGG